ncbi:unhealthy ribosome biogenesis protein 2 homolog [Bufo gargarizans]|uniref:unhealthy ribosome biogenesis protein 2 homolog n=1 Tax=Bufo gargarizans TaxID=30331 RepID=UPI001CF41544|nr:unhealthy ribosome biogenesis protein 2 homolog [Bufo gargarizans]
MAGVYSGIHLKMKGSKISWGHKLKLAHFAWISHQCLIPNKEQFLLDWVSQALVGFHTKKQSLEEDVEQKLWIFLDKILHSSRLQSLMEEGKSLKLRFAIAQVMNDIIAVAPTQSSPSSYIGTVLSCCQGVLSTPCFGMLYRAKCELLVELLSKLCLLACHCVHSQHAIMHQVLNVLNKGLKRYTVLQRQQNNSSRLFTHVLSQLFEPFLVLQNALNIHVFDKDANHGIHQLIKDIGSNMEIVLHTGLFQAELFSFYKEELVPQLEKSEKKKGSFKDFMTPVLSMLAKLEKIEFCEKNMQLSFLSNSVSLLYKLFLDSYCREGNEIICFQMLVKLFRCLCAPFAEKQDDVRESFPAWPGGITALESMLNLVLSHNIYNIAEDNIGKGSQYKFYRSLTEILVSNTSKPSPPWFKCLQTLNLLNHRILEPDLADIMHACFDADVSDIHVRKAQESFVISLLKTYAKLRQVPKLFAKILTVICQLSTEKLKNPILLSGLTKVLVEFLVQLPPNQMLDMWAMILENCQLHHIEDDQSLSLQLEHLCSLLHCLMMNMKSLDSNTPVLVIHRYQDLMKQITEELILPSLTILKECDVEADDTLLLEKLCEVVLMLLYTWIEVDTVSALNCDKYTSQMCKLVLPLDLPLECWNFSIFFEDKECWHKIHRLCKQSSLISLFYSGLLSIQKIKLILLHMHMPTEYEILTLQASASFFVDSSIILMNPKGQEPVTGNVIAVPNAVNVNCLPVTQWHFFVSNIVILLPYISLTDMYNIADFLLETHLSAKNQSKQVDGDVTIAFKEVSKSLLQGDSFSEMGILQCIFITSILKKGIMLVREQTGIHEILSLLSLKDTDWHEYTFSVYNKGNTIVNPRVIDSCDDSVFVTNMKNVLQLISSVPKMNESVSFTDTDLIMKLIELICDLKPDSLSPPDLCRCFLFLLSLANSSSLKSLHVASECYKGLTCLLSSTHANYLFKIAYASDLLKVVLTCIQSANWTVTETNEPYWQNFLDIMNSFFDTFLSLVIKRKQSILVNLETFTAFLLNSVSNMEKTFWSTLKGQLHIVILKNLCHHFIVTIQEQSSNEEHTERLSSLLKQIAGKLKTVIQQCLELAAASPLLPFILVTSTTTLLQAELADGNLHSSELYRLFCSQILKELCYAKEQNAFLKSALHYLTVCIPVKEVYPKPEGLAISVFTAVGNLLASPWFNSQILQNAEVELQQLLNGVTENCTCEEFHTLLTFVFNKLEVCNLWRKRYKVLFAGITMTRLLLKCSLEEDKRTLFWSAASQIIASLVALSIEACKEHTLISTVVVPVLHTMALFLRQGEHFLINPHHVTLSLSTLLTVPLENVKTEDFYTVFLAIHEVLFSVLQCHPKVMLKSVPTFLSCFHRLVASVLHEGQQKGDKGIINIQKCAKLVERKYTFIAAKTEEFTVFSTFIVSQYIHELQKVTLQPEVKKYLTEGIFHILDICIDRDIKFLNTSFQIGAREMFKEIYCEYSSHYRTRNQKEEKYTV